MKSKEDDTGTDEMDAVEETNSKTSEEEEESDKEKEMEIREKN